MKREFLALYISLIVISFTFGQSDPIKIMPLGNSITQGEDKTYTGGAISNNTFRRILWHELVDTLGYDIDFIGSLNNNYACGTYENPDFDLDHEGHWAWRVDHIIYGRSGTCNGDGRLGLWLQSAGVPDITLVHLGTNDCWNSQSTSSTILELEAMVDTLRAYNAGMTILLCQIIGHQDPVIQNLIDDLNDSIPQIIDDMSTTLSPIILVDQATGFDPITDLYDSAHPNLSGEEKMAAKYLEKLVPVLDSITMTGKSSMKFGLNDPIGVDDYGISTTLPDSFGTGDFTFQIWIQPDTSFPIGNTLGYPDQLYNWYDGDPEPGAEYGWWFQGNFLLDGHNNNSGWTDGTFSIQMYGGGRIRWHFGDGYTGPANGPYILQAYPATNVPTLLDGKWHLVTCTRQMLENGAVLSLWVDDYMVERDTSINETNMRDYWDSWTQFNQPGWFFGVEKQVAPTNDYYDDYKGLIDDMSFYTRTKMGPEISDDFNRYCKSELGLVGDFSFDEGAGNKSFNALNMADSIEWFNDAITNWQMEDANECSEKEVGKAWYVAASGTGDGTSWVTASGDLATILATASNGDSILISEGSFYPTDGTDQNISFVMSKGISVFGGFEIGGGSFSNRDILANETILNGDIGVPENINDNVFHVVRIPTLDGPLLIDGLTIKGGLNQNGRAILTAPAANNYRVELKNVNLLR